MKINKKQDIVFYNNAVYQIPTSIDVRNELGSKPNILKKRIELTGKLGLEFKDKEGGFGCIDCKYTGIFEAVMLNDLVNEPIAEIETYEKGDIPGISQPNKIIIGAPFFTNDAKMFCKYLLNPIDPIWLSYFHRQEKRKKIGFAAIMKPCIVDTGLLMTLIKERELDKYKAEENSDFPIHKFPYISQIKPDTESEQKAIELYNKYFKQNKTLIQRIKSFFIPS